MSLDMRAAVFRKDYRQPDYWIREVALEFDLLPEATKVTARLSVEPNAAGTAGAPLVLDGEDVRLRSLSIDGRDLAATAYTVGERSLSIAKPPATAFTLAIVPDIAPAKNTHLTGQNGKAQGREK